MPDADEQQLDEGAQRDPSRFAELYERHFDRVHAYVVIHGSSGDTADRVTSEECHKRLEQALRSMPRARFRARLRAALERTAAMTTAIETPASVRRRATPQLRLANAAAAIDFYTFFFQAEDGIRDTSVTGVQTCALPI